MVPYTWKISRYEIFTEQEANRIFAIIFLRITGPSWKVAHVMYCYKPLIVQTSKFSRIKVAHLNPQNYSYVASTTAINNAAASQLPAIKLITC